MSISDNLKTFSLPSGFRGDYAFRNCKPSVYYSDEAPSVKDDRIDMKAIREGIRIARTEPEFIQNINEATGQFSYEMSQRVGASVDEIVAEELYKMMIKRLGRIPIVKQECRNCGGVLQVDSDKHIFHCPYCNTVYAVGVEMINAR